MPIVRKPKATLTTFSAAQKEAALAAAPTGVDAVDWSKGTTTSGDGVAATLQALRRVRSKNKQPTREQVAIRLDREVLAKFRASGRGWQTRVNAALVQWVKEHEIA